VGSNPSRDAKVAVLKNQNTLDGLEALSLRQMLEMLLGEDLKRQLRLRQMTNDELFESYDAELINHHQSAKALNEERRVLGHFKEYLGQWPPSPESAKRFLAQFRELKTWTRYHYTQVISAFMSWYGQNLNIKISVPHKLPEYVKEDDTERLLAAISNRPTHKKNINRDTLLVEVALNTGLRRSELSNLKVSDIHLDQGVIVVRDGKGNKDAIIPLTNTLAERLASYIRDMRPEANLFNLKPSSISAKIHWFAKKANVNLHTHSLRHRFGTRLLEGGANPEAVRQLMRHESLGTTQRYVALSSAGLKEAIDVLDKAKPKSAEPEHGWIDYHDAWPERYAPPQTLPIPIARQSENK
jgi:integrase